LFLQKLPPEHKIDQPEEFIACESSVTAMQCQVHVGLPDSLQSRSASPFAYHGDGNHRLLGEERRSVFNSFNHILFGILGKSDEVASFFTENRPF